MDQTNRHMYLYATSSIRSESRGKKSLIVHQLYIESNHIIL